MSRLLVNASSQRKVRCWRAAFGVRAGAESSRKKHSKHARWIRPEAFCVPETPESDSTPVCEITPLRRAIGIQFP